MRVAIFFFFTFLTISVCHAQLEPVKWTFQAEKISDSEYDIVVTADIDNGWSVYSQHIEEDAGPIPTSLNIYNETDVELVGLSKEAGMKQETFDENFGMKLVKFSRKARFTQRVKVVTDTTTLEGHLTYMTCDSESCMPPTDVDFSIALSE